MVFNMCFNMCVYKYMLYLGVMDTGLLLCMKDLELWPFLQK